MSINFQPIGEKIKKILNKKLTNSETLNEKELYLNEEHEQLCYYYKKYMEVKLKLETLNKKLTIKYMRNIIDEDENSTLISNEFNNNIKYKEVEYHYNIKYNNYNKKFINKLNYVFNYDYINDFLKEQHLFLSSLTTREIYNIKYYTYHGDIYLNAFIQGNFSLDLLKGYSGNLVSNENDLCYFFYQLKDYFKYNKYNGELININDNNIFISFIKKECFNFDIDIYNYIFTNYLIEMKDIFKKAPKTTNKLILYRGISKDYLSLSLKNNYYKNTQFTSTSFFFEKAFDYASTKNKMIIKINVNVGMPIIFVEGITLAEKDFEVIIPINAIFYVKNPFKEVKYYKKKDDLLCPDENSTIINMIELSYIY